MKLNPPEVYNMFKELTNEELLFVIKNYSIGVYNLLNNKDRLKVSNNYIDIYNRAKILYPMDHVDEIIGIVDNIKNATGLKSLDQVKNYLDSLLI